jgi:hypothetical protein
MTDDSSPAVTGAASASELQHELHAQLVAGGIDSGKATALARDLILRGNLENAHERVQDAITLHRGGIPDHAIGSIVQGTERHPALTLLARGIPGTVITHLWQVDWLGDALFELENGRPLDIVVRVADHRSLELNNLVDLTRRGMTDSHLEMLLGADAGKADLTSVLASGGTWEDIEALLLARTGNTSGTLDAYTETLEPATKDLPVDVRRLAARLAGTCAGHMLDYLPAAAAITGQPWEDTALTLLTENNAGNGDAWPTLILAARALETDSGTRAAAGSSQNDTPATAVDIDTLAARLTDQCTRARWPGDPHALRAYAAACALLPWTGQVGGPGDNPHEDPRLTLTNSTITARSLDAPQRNVTISAAALQAAGARQHTRR